MEVSWVLTVTPLIPKPPSSEPFLQKNIPTYPASVFSEMPEGSREKGIRDTPPLTKQALGNFQYGAAPGLPVTLGPPSLQGKNGLSSPSARRLSLRCQRNPPTQEMLESSKRPPTANNTGSRGIPEGPGGRRYPLVNPKRLALGPEQHSLRKPISD